MGPWTLALSASAFWLGILMAGSMLHGAPPSLGALVAAGIVMACLAAGRPPAGGTIGRVMVCTAFVAMGAGWGGLHQARVRGSPTARLVGRTVTIVGTLGSVPQPGPFGWGGTMRADLILPGDGDGDSTAIRSPDSLWLDGHGQPPPVPEGERVMVEGVLRPLRGSFGAYLSRRGYAAVLGVGELRDRGPPASPLLRAANWVRGSLRRSLASVLPRRHVGLLMGLTLGDTSQLDPSIESSFRATGLSHLTAVSGENLAMFLAPVLGVAVALGLGRRARFGVGLGAIGFFVLLTGAEPSVLRAAAMAGLTLIGILLGRPRSAPAILGGAVLALLAMDPTLVYAVGFQLSVAATAGMALLAAPIADRLRFLPPALALAGATTLSAQAGVLPLLLYYFGVVPTVTIPANLLAFPAVGPAMLLGLVAGGMGLLWRPAGAFVAWLATFPLGYLEALAARLARWPLPSITSPGGQAPVLALGFAVVGMAGWWVGTGRRMPRRAIVMLGLVVPVFVWMGAVRAGPPGSLTVVFFDVGQGDAALIRSPGGAVILIDAGPDPERVAVKLAALGVRRLDLVVATHPHADHVAGLPTVLARFGVSLVIDPGCRGDSPSYAEFLRAVRRAHLPFRHPRPGATYRVADVMVEVLGPTACARGTASDANNDSLVLRVVDGSASILFPGDAEVPSQEEILRAEAGGLTASVLKVPHHGGATSFEPFIQAVGARVAVVSVGPNRYGHPVSAVLTGLEADGMRVFRTDRSGDVTVTFHGPSVVVATSG